MVDSDRRLNAAAFNQLTAPRQSARIAHRAPSNIIAHQILFSTRHLTVNALKAELANATHIRMHQHHRAPHIIIDELHIILALERPFRNLHLAKLKVRLTIPKTHEPIIAAARKPRAVRPDHVIRHASDFFRKISERLIKSQPRKIKVPKVTCLQLGNVKVLNITFKVAAPIKRRYRLHSIGRIKLNRLPLQIFLRRLIKVTPTIEHLSGNNRIISRCRITPNHLGAAIHIIISKRGECRHHRACEANRRLAYARLIKYAVRFQVRSLRRRRNNDIVENNKCADFNISTIRGCCLCRIIPRTPNPKAHWPAVIDSAANTVKTLIATAILDIK